MGNFASRSFVYGILLGVGISTSVILLILNHSNPSAPHPLKNNLSITKVGDGILPPGSERVKEEELPEEPHTIRNTISNTIAKLPDISDISMMANNIINQRWLPRTPNDGLLEANKSPIAESIMAIPPITSEQGVHMGKRPPLAKLQPNIGHQALNPLLPSHKQPLLPLPKPTESSLTSNITHTSPEREQCRHRYGQRNYLPEHLRRLPPILYTFPGSGNTWCRLLIEYGTGVYTGSVYNDDTLLKALPGEFTCNWQVSAIKVHPHTESDHYNQHKKHNYLTRMNRNVMKIHTKQTYIHIRTTSLLTSHCVLKSFRLYFLFA